MAVIGAALIGAWLLMLVAPEARYVRGLRHLLVERPAAALNRITPSHILMAVAVTVVVGTAMWFEAGDLIGFLSLAAPEFVSWALTFEIGTLVEAGVAVLTITASRRSGVSGTMARLVGRRIARAGRQRRSRRAAGERAANDDADEHRERFAA